MGVAFSSWVGVGGTVLIRVAFGGGLAVRACSIKDAAVKLGLGLGVEVGIWAEEQAEINPIGRARENNVSTNFMILV